MEDSSELGDSLGDSVADAATEADAASEAEAPAEAYAAADDRSSVSFSKPIQLVSLCNAKVEQNSEKSTVHKCPLCDRKYFRLDYIKDHLLAKHGLCPVVNSKGFSPYKPGCKLRKATEEEIAHRYRNNSKIVRNKKRKVTNKLGKIYYSLICSGRKNSAGRGNAPPQ